MFCEGWRTLSKHFKYTKTYCDLKLIIAFKREEIVTWKALCFQDSKVSNLVSIISRTPLKVSKLDSSLDPPNFWELRIGFRESSFEGLPTYFWPVLYLLILNKIEGEGKKLPHKQTSEHKATKRNSLPNPGLLSGRSILISPKFHLAILTASKPCIF